MEGVRHSTVRLQKDHVPSHRKTGTLPNKNYCIKLKAVKIVNLRASGGRGGVYSVISIMGCIT